MLGVELIPILTFLVGAAFLFFGVINISKIPFQALHNEQLYQFSQYASVFPPKFVGARYSGSQLRQGTAIGDFVVGLALLLGGPWVQRLGCLLGMAIMVCGIYVAARTKNYQPAGISAGLLIILLYIW